ncbi:MAG: NAD(P)/FAD-dependent oxidoreductase [Acetobacteraceae bacterium]
MAGDITTDVAIIGAGPVGLFAVFECGMLRMKTVLIDVLAAAGGQCTALYPEKPIYDIPAHPMISASTLIAELERQIAPFAPPRLLGRRACRLEGAAGSFCLVTDQEERVHAKAVIIAAGAGAFGPNRPPLAGLADFEAAGGVQYYVASREALRGKRVIIAGGGDSAVDWALALAGIAAELSLVHRREKFRAAPETSARLAALATAGKLRLIVPFQLSGLRGHRGTLEAVEVSRLAGGEIRLLPADVLLAFFGLSTDLGPIADWGLALEGHQLIVDPASLETSRPGVFAIGDVASHGGKLKLILQGFSEAAMAAHAVHPIVFPGQALHFEYSTTTGVPDLAIA